jgi:hypothetical protein
MIYTGRLDERGRLQGVAAWGCRRVRVREKISS